VIVDDFRILDCGLCFVLGSRLLYFAPVVYLVLGSWSDG
jgi:hypothetical protein